jgi:fimbrial chaperone protein
MRTSAMNRILLATIAAVLCSAACNGAQASSLQVAPVLVEVTLPAAASSLRLRNFGTKPITAQVRMFRWSQQNGLDHLAETRDVVASPPFVEIGADAAQLVRIVRVSKQPLDAEESYRLLIDEIPERPSARASGVDFAVRYSIPVFFAGAAVRSAPLVWSVEQRADRLTVTASNPGSRRVRVAALRVSDPQGKMVAFGDGLAGYVLGGATAQWSIEGKLTHAAVGSVVAISANTDNGPLQATGIVRTPR